MIRTGLDRLLASERPLVGRRYGLLSHSAARAADLSPIHLALLQAGVPTPTRLFGPEHGFHGVEQDMVGSADEVEPWTGLPTISLYGDSDGSLRPDPATLEDLDLLVIDLQDVGARYYTYAATGVWAASTALSLGVEVWILDRPNPLGGVEIEGPGVGEGFASFVGAFNLPVRHGLTLGELARLEAQRSGWPEGLMIWQVEGWRRTMLWSDLGRPWFAPSPNLPTEEITLLYPGLCLVEGTELSEGRGTTRPFQLLGAPGFPAQPVVAELESLALPGVRFLPIQFRPQFHKHAGKVCAGIETRVVDSRRLRPLRCGVELLAAIARLAPESLEWRRQAYEFVSDRPALDLLSGDGSLRGALEADGQVAEWIGSWSQTEAEFRQERREILLYPDEPGDGPGVGASS